MTAGHWAVVAPFAAVAIVVSMMFVQVRLSRAHLAVAAWSRRHNGGFGGCFHRTRARSNPKGLEYVKSYQSESGEFHRSVGICNTCQR